MLIWTRSASLLLRGDDIAARTEKGLLFGW
jgi:hypothetical protein